MKGHLTTFTGVADSTFDGVAISSIEIPSIQRDYAQGRRSQRVDTIREDFLDVLLTATTGGTPVGLDFVYGKVDGDGVLQPLDGQQRLTTLFLIHWYIASAAGSLDPTAAWTKFSYATRPSARLFCQRIVKQAFVDDGEMPSDWLVDQPWFLHTWHTDPSIQSMLVVLDDIHTRLTSMAPTFDPVAAWAALTNEVEPAISFYLLPLDDMQPADELYITMNSRGKPLTDFENFKATFQTDLAGSARATELAQKIDGPWSDLLWPIHGGDFLVDDEFMRLIDFVVEICELKDGYLGSGSLASRARDVFGSTNSHAEQHLGLLFDVFDTWQDSAEIDAFFGALLSVDKPGFASYDASKTIAYGNSVTNLFGACCHTFDSQKSGTRTFSLQQSLLFYAVLLHRIHSTDDFARRLRIIRNLVADSEDELRREAMPSLIADVEVLVLTGDLGSVKRLSSKQVADEQLKVVFLAAHPELESHLLRLEDHPFLRGNLSSFDLDASSFASRAEAFESAFVDPNVWSRLTGALLATGDYFRKRRRSSGWQFGTGSPKNAGVWRYLFTGATREELASTRQVLGAFLNSFSESSLGVAAHCDALITQALDEATTSGQLDWQYYLLKYPEMRTGDSGIYHGVDGELGFELCMLKKTQLNSLYRDAVLLQLYRAIGSDEGLMENPWFSGWTTEPRHLRLRRSGATVQNVSTGLAFLPGSRTTSALSQALGHDHSAADGGAILVSTSTDGVRDDADRIQVGVTLLRRLFEEGF